MWCSGPIFLLHLPCLLRTCNEIWWDASFDSTQQCSGGHLPEYYLLTVLQYVLFSRHWSQPWGTPVALASPPEYSWTSEHVTNIWLLQTVEFVACWLIRFSISCSSAERLHTDKETNSSFLPFTTCRQSIDKLGQREILISGAGRLSSISLLELRRPGDKTRDRTIILHRQDWWRGWEEQVKEREQKRYSIVVGNRVLQQGPCSGTQGAVVILQQEASNTGRSPEGNRCELRDLCVCQVTMAGSGRELAEQEEPALFKDFKAGQTSPH